MNKTDDMEEGRRLHEAVLNEHMYDYVKPLGKGGFSSVYLVWSRQYECNFAVKVSDLSAKHACVNTSEIDLLMTISHPHIIKLYAHFQENNFLYVVLEYCENGSLEDMIKSDRLTGRQCLAYFAEVASAVEACHQAGIAHRDIKPSNILVDSYGQAKLADFGLGITSKRDSLVGYTGCSIAFSPPELFTQKAIDPFKSDVWSLGIMLYYMMSRELPWSTGSRQGLIAQIKQGIQLWSLKIPYPVRKLIIQMTAMNPSDRPLPGQILAAQVVQDNENAMASQLLVPHQSISSDMVIRYSTGTSFPLVDGMQTERKDTIKSFGAIGLTTLMKRRKSVISHMVKRDTRKYNPSQVLQPKQTFAGTKRVQMPRLIS